MEGLKDTQPLDQNINNPATKQEQQLSNFLNEDLPPLGDNASENLHEVASSQPTEDGGGFDSDAMLDPPIQNVGDVQEVTFDKKVKKEILEVGSGVKKPKMNYLVNIIYTAYFYDHTVFDTSNGQTVQISIGDISWPEGLWKGIQEMRQGEKSKIKIKKKYGFGRKEQVDKLKFPPGYEEEGSQNRERLMTKGIIYEVQLVDWVERIDIEADGNFLKTFIIKPASKEWERPTEIDEVTYSLKVYYSSSPLSDAELPDILYEQQITSTTMNDPQITLTFRKILESMKRNEQSRVEVKQSYIIEQDQQLVALLGDKFDASREFITVEAQLLDYVKVEDWFKDGGSCKKRILRKGKGSSPNAESTIKLRLKITVNDQVVLNNWEEGNPKELYDANKLNTEEEKSSLSSDPGLYTFTLDKYNIPALLKKVLMTMRPNEVCEFIATSHYEKLRSNFPSDLFNQYELFQEGDHVSFLICLLDKDKDFYFYQLTASEKLSRVQFLKGIAGQFFKLENYKKAARLYQKINGYYNFGDVSNNHAKEDDQSEEYKKLQEELRQLKITSFMNLVVCKFKTKEWESIIGITDQVLEMEPKHVKCLYFRGKAYIELQEYDKSVQTLHKLVEIDPSHVDGRKEYERAKQIRQKFHQDQHKKFSKMFS